MAGTNGQVVEDRVDKAASDLSEIGGTGLEHYAGTLNEEKLLSLQGRRGIATLVEMTHYPVVGAVLLAIDNLVQRVTWEFDPPEDPGTDGDRWVDLCSSCLHDMSSSWSDTTSSIFSFAPFGWAFAETVLKRRNGEQPDRPGAPPSSDYDDGLVGWRKIELRAQESLDHWELSENGSVLGMWQQLQNGPVKFIPITKAGLFRTSNRKNSPEGSPALRSAYDPWRFVRKIKEIEGIGIERDLAGLPKAGVPPEWLGTKATVEQKRAVLGLKTMLANVRRNSMEGLLFPRELDERGNDRFDFSLVSTAGRRQIDIGSTIARYNQEIALSVLCDWVLLGHTAVGSRALADPKIDVFMSALETWTGKVCEVFNSHLTPRLMRANGVPGRLAPQLRAGKVRQVDLLEFAQAMGELVSSGAVTQDRDTEGFIREQIGLPPQMEPEDIDPEDQALRSPEPPAPVDQDQLDEDKPEEPETAPTTAKQPTATKKRWRRAA